MPSKIHVLSDKTINQIAAGEVVENPASVVKELVDNAIDAGATHISIEISGGGFQHIGIIDNGSGMNGDDALLCLERHATSKINVSEDLETLHTMGFRGEALASIAAISKMSMTTALQDSVGVCVEVEGGKVCRVGAAARTRGTTIDVRSLFYNVPARKQFQKSITASSAEITRTVTHLALAHVDVGFELVQQKNSIFSVSAVQDFAARVQELLGADFLSATHTLDFAENGHVIRGVIGSPKMGRYNRSGQYLFVNHRPVVCLPIAYAIRDGYATRLDADRHPIYVVHITVPPNMIDVNVHPQKREIRLREEHLLKHYLRTAVSSSLERSESRDYSFPTPLVDVTDIERYMPMETPLRENFVLREQTVQPEIPLAEEIRPLGLFDSYLLVEAHSVSSLCALKEPSGVVWVDLLAAEARILFERCLYFDRPCNATAQGLLFPISFACSKAEAAVLLQSLDQVRALGIQLRAVGPTAFIVEAIPEGLDERDVVNILHEMIAMLPQELSSAEKKMRKLAELVSRAARARQKRFSQPEAIAVLKQLMKTQDPFHCPQGKETLYHVRKNEIEDYFAGKRPRPHLS